MKLAVYLLLLLPVTVEQLITDKLDLWTSATTHKTTSGRGRNGKLELTGLKKLRELILELAVRGKLVPQDPTDEPASVLLEKIAAEKARLVKEGKIKKPKALPKIVEDEKPFELPQGWLYKQLGEIAYKLTDGSHNPPKDSGYGFPMLSSQNVNYGEVDFKSPSRFVTEEDFERENARTLITSGDVLLTIVASLGRSAVVPENSPKFVLQRSVAVIGTIINPQFLASQLVAPSCLSYYDEHGKGTAQKGIYLGKLSLMPLLIPPLAEQRRIVEKVDELMGLCDRIENHTLDHLAAHETLVDTLLDTLTQADSAAELADNWNRLAAHFDTLFTTEHSCDRLKQTILQHAVMGRLVPQDPTDEPASVLLEKIAAEKARLVKEGKIKKPRVLQKITHEELHHLPNGWQWVRLGELVSVMDAGWSPACPPEQAKDLDSWGVLKTTAVQVMEYKENENKALPENKEPKPQYEVQKGDILITRAGPKNRVAISCLVGKTRPRLMISDKIIRFHLFEVGMSERFVSLCLNTGVTSDYLEKAKSGMAESQMNISQDKLKLAPVPLASVLEQHRIVQKVDALMALCDQLKTRLAHADDTRRHLAEAVVDQAIQ